MSTVLLSDHSCCNESYKAKPSVQSDGNGKFQGVVTIAALGDGTEFTRHLTPEVYGSYATAFEAAKRFAVDLIRQLQPA